jgi:hypothetical protein
MSHRIRNVGPTWSVYTRSCSARGRSQSSDKKNTFLNVEFFKYFSTVYTEYEKRMLVFAFLDAIHLHNILHVRLSVLYSIVHNRETEVICFQCTICYCICVAASLRTTVTPPPPFYPRDRSGGRNWRCLPFAEEPWMNKV